MPKRWNYNQRQWAYRFLVTRDGEFCQRCGKIPATPYSLCIDHRDSNPKNDDPSNLRLLCRSCNTILENKSRRASLSGDYVCVCVKNCVAEKQKEMIEGKPMTRIAKEDAGYRQGSPEMQANLLFEVTFRRWLLGEINIGQSIDKKEAINTGAEFVGCSIATTRRYLVKLTSKGGCLKEEKDMLGHPYLIFKSNFEKGIYPDSRLSITELIKQVEKVKAKIAGDGHKTL